MYVGYGKLSEGGEYEMADSMSSITAGVIQQFGDILLLKHALVFIFPYAYIYQHYRLLRRKMRYERY